METPTISDINPSKSRSPSRISTPTILHLLGLDYNKLSFHHDTRDEKLTDVHQPNVIREILA